MFRKVWLAVCLVPLVASVGYSQEWANKMFKVRTHDFGAVAKGAKVYYEFEIENIYEETVHIASVRSSCGCTSPSIKNDTLKTWEKGAIVAKLNTDSFLGHKSATVTVTIDKPFYAEVQLNVSTNIRGDVVFEPGSVQFGNVQLGEASVAKVHVTQAGRSDWQITDVRSNDDYLGVDLKETNRGGGRVGYDLTVHLKDNAPVGFISSQLALITNDGSSRSVSLPVEGKVESPLNVSPSALSLGELQPGEKTEAKLIVRAKKPFKITNVQCDSECFQFAALSEEPKKLHFLPLTFTAGKDGGTVVKKITIETDLGNGISGESVATAVVKEANSET
ncbi:DUF1573 domain-containing protein [Bremerella sp. T1]|uniref:DUF1573 domain-containing protein n=1 Tax=Bremerella sp. TYQ1 TaxID=3119568 RepID=UPI001CCC46A3|nr:DUF1573 domain-containing protein [Bremerella volcania]UBM35626.1 DUF1573 domain-containing protein [Bremerella volcania]